jgi:hypothetical protein
MHINNIIQFACWVSTHAMHPLLSNKTHPTTALTLNPKPYIVNPKNLPSHCLVHHSPEPETIAHCWQCCNDVVQASRTAGVQFQLQLHQHVIKLIITAQAHNSSSSSSSRGLCQHYSYRRFPCAVAMRGETAN